MEQIRLGGGTAIVCDTSGGIKGPVKCDWCGKECQRVKEPIENIWKLEGQFRKRSRKVIG